MAHYVTPHFTVEEFARFARPDKGFPQTIPYPEEWIGSRLKPLCSQLEIIRAELGGHSMKVNSGYRDPNYNAAIKGALMSQHMAGRAADITVAGINAETVHAAVLAMCKAGKLPLVRGLGHYPTFAHVDIRESATLVQWVGARRES